MSFAHRRTIRWQKEATAFEITVTGDDFDTVHQRAEQLARKQGWKLAQWRRIWRKMLKWARHRNLRKP